MGNARTALVNWLVARGSGGSMVLRIEDTDRERGVRGAERRILDDLAWLGLDWDEGPDRGGDRGPYRQSERLERYRRVGRALRERDHAYFCFCSEEELAEARPSADGDEGGAGCPGECESLDVEVARRRLDSGKEAAVRFRMPRGEIAFDDGLRDRVAFEAAQFPDFVVLRRDGTPTYQLACVVDDHAMEIDRVVRGEDHLPNTPRQLAIFQAMGWRPPAYTHLPLVLGADRARLSKRHGAVTVGEMRRIGILPVALCNYLALLGWEPPGGDEVLSLEELVEAFAVDELSTSNAVFDHDKLEWLNGQHLARQSPAALLAAGRAFLAAAGHRIPDGGEGREWWCRALKLAASKVRRLDRVPEVLRPVLEPDLAATCDDPETVAELDDPDATQVLRCLAEASEAGELNTRDGFRGVARRIGDRVGVGGRRLYHPIRLAITGRHAGPELAELVPLIETARAIPGAPEIASVAERVRTALAGIGATDG